MVLGVGVGAYGAAVFHLMTHAFFKACLFLGSGSVIHAMGDEQDMRKMGGLREKMPLTFWTFLISTIAIAGIPPLAGFFSKDEILWLTFSGGHPFLWLIGFAAAGMTAFYMFRQVFMVFFGENRADEHTKEHLHESPPVMTYPLIVLAVGALFAGFLGVPPALGGSNILEHWFEPVFAGGHGGGHAAHHHVEVIEYVLMVASVGIAAVGIFLAYLIYYRQSLSAETFTAVGGGVPYQAVFNKYYVDELYQATAVRGTLVVSWLCSAFDRNVIDFIVNGVAKVTGLVGWAVGRFDHYIIDGLVNGLADVTFGIGNRLRQIQTGNLSIYLYVIVGAIAISQFLPRVGVDTLLPVVVVFLSLVIVVGIALWLSTRRIQWRLMFTKEGVSELR